VQVGAEIQRWIVLSWTALASVRRTDILRGKSGHKGASICVVEATNTLPGEAEPAQRGTYEQHLENTSTSCLAKKEQAISSREKGLGRGFESWRSPNIWAQCGKRVNSRRKEGDAVATPTPKPECHPGPSFSHPTSLTKPSRF
jgi:hypothetical protein